MPMKGNVTDELEMLFEHFNIGVIFLQCWLLLYNVHSIETVCHWGEPGLLPSPDLLVFISKGMLAVKRSSNKNTHF